MQSTSFDVVSDVTLAGMLPLKPGTRVSVTRGDGSVEVGTVLKHEAGSSFVKITPPAVRWPRNQKMTAHRQMGHSFWPRRNSRHHRYECSKCGMEKRPGTKADMDCENYLRFKVVQAVHDR